MKLAELKELSFEEIKEQEAVIRRELWNAKFQNHANQLDNTSMIKTLRKNLAQVKTLIRQQELKLEKEN